LIEKTDLEIPGMLIPKDPDILDHYSRLSVNYLPHNLFKVVVLCMVLLLVNAHRLQAHPYHPLKSGMTKTFKYHFHIKNANKTAKLSNVNGEILMQFDNFEEKNGKLYLRQTTTYRNIPYWKTEQHTWRREENGNIYLGWMLNGKWNEALELPKDVSVGSEWKYNDGEKSTRKVTRIFNLNITGGKVFSDCLEITHSIAGNQPSDLIDISYYCRDIGDAGSVVRQPTPVGEYTTETSLENYHFPE
jgi:hypothetical protein